MAREAPQRAIRSGLLVDFAARSVDRVELPRVLCHKHVAAREVDDMRSFFEWL